MRSSEDRSDAVIEVRSGPDGLATIYDYDIVLMMISHLAEAAKFHRQGRAPLLAKVFRPHASEIFKFIRVEHGGASYHEPPPDCRRPFGLSYTAMAGWSSMA